MRLVETGNEAKGTGNEPSGGWNEVATRLTLTLPLECLCLLNTADWSRFGKHFLQEFKYIFSTEIIEGLDPAYRRFAYYSLPLWCSNYIVHVVNSCYNMLTVITPLNFL